VKRSVFFLASSDLQRRCLRQKKWVGFNLECGKLENGKLEAILISKITAMGISKKSNGYLEFSLENGNLKKSNGYLEFSLENRNLKKCVKELVVQL